MSQTKKHFSIGGRPVLPFARMVEKVSNFTKSKIPMELYLVLNFGQQRYIQYC